MKKTVALLNILFLCLTASAALADSTIGNLEPGGLVQPSDYFPVARVGCVTEGDCKVQVGTAAAAFIGTTGGTLGLLNTANTYSAQQNFLSGDLIAADADFIGAAITLPAGTTSQRPGSPSNGMLRYNTSLTALEAYVGGAWGPIGGSSGGGTPGGSVGNLQINAGSGSFGPYPGLTCASHKWLNALDADGTVSSDCVQPNFTDMAGTAANSQIPTPTTGALGGLLALASSTAHNVVQYIDTSGVQHLYQVLFSDLGGTLSYGQMPNSGVTAGSYTNISGTVNAEGIFTAISSGSGGGGGSLTVGTSSISSGTTTRVLFDNAGVLGEYLISGTGNVAMTASPTFSGTLNGAASIWSGVEKINLNAASLPSAQTGTVLQIGNADSTATRVEADSFGAAAYFSGVRKDGTNASPTTLQSGDEIGGYNAFGYNGTAVVGPQASFRTFARQNWSVGANGTYADIAVTPDAGTTLTEVAYFSTAGIGIGTATPNSSLDLSQKTDALSLPAGTSAQRPGSPNAGMIRYNSTATPAIEAYVNGIWEQFGVAPDRTVVIGTTIAQGDMGGQINLNGSSLTATIPAISTTVFAANQNVVITNYNSSALTISSTPTINGYPGTSIGQYGWLSLLSNGTSLDGFGFPGFGTITNNALEKFSSTSGISTASGLSDNGTTVSTAEAVTVTNTVTGNLLVSPPSTLTISTATFTPAAAGSNTFRVLLVHASCPCTLANPSGTLVDGTKYLIEVWQSSTGSDLINTYGSEYDFGTAGAPTLSTGANKGDLLGFEYSAQNSKLNYLGIEQGM